MKKEGKSRSPPRKDPVYRIRFEAKFCLEWSKGILKSLGTSLKQLFHSVAGIINYFANRWFKGSLP